MITLIARPALYLPGGIVGGPDGNIWFVEDHCPSATAQCAGGRIVNIAPNGADNPPTATFKEFSLPDPTSFPGSIAKGSDGNLWFTDLVASNGIGRITPAGEISGFATPTAGSRPIDIATGPEGNMWFVEANDVHGDKVGRIALDVAAMEISPGFTGNWFDSSQSGHGLSIEVLPGNQMLVDWYVFAPNGGQSWIVATGPITGNSAVLQGFQSVGTGGRFPPLFDSAHVQNQSWGTITISFTDCKNGQVSWQPTAAGYTSGSMPITRLTMPAGLTCQ